MCKCHYGTYHHLHILVKVHVYPCSPYIPSRCIIRLCSQLLLLFYPCSAVLKRYQQCLQLKLSNMCTPFSANNYILHIEHFAQIDGVLTHTYYGVKYYTDFKDFSHISKRILNGQGLICHSGGTLYPNRITYTLI